MKKQFVIITIIVNILFIFTTYGNSVSAYSSKCEKVITEKCGYRIKPSPESICNAMHKNKTKERIDSCIKNLEESRKKEKKEYNICRERIIKSKQYKDCTSKYFLPPGNPKDFINSLPAPVKGMLIVAGIFVY